MKKIIIVSLLAIFTFGGCFLWKDITFYFNDTVETTIPATASFLPFDLPIPTVSTSATQEYENQGIVPSQIKEIVLNNLIITITAPADEDFSFLDAIYVYIQKSDGSDEQEIAYLENINSTATSITLETTGVNLVDYLRDENGYKLRIRVKVKEVLNNDVDIKVDLNFKVVARIL